MAATASGAPSVHAPSLEEASVRTEYRSTDTFCWTDEVEEWRGLVQVPSAEHTLESAAAAAGAKGLTSQK